LRLFESGAAAPTPGDCPRRHRPLSARLGSPALPHASNFTAERLGTPTSREWFGRRLTRRGYGKELDDLGNKSVREFLQNGNGRIFETAFEATDVGAVDPGIRGKSFLR
jgi:hypothetical protein